MGLPRDNSPDDSDHASLADVKNDIVELKNDIADLVSGLAESGIDLAKRSAATTKKTAEEVHSKMTDTISERPITSVAIAFGVGALAAKLFTRG